ncbi:transcriptional regulator [Nocardia sp. NEAU-G5]|uniref:Transcriptional regulator n=1 Tax=Nocardia albiluteola TaxID=2842303 RepID=A0ABS6AUM7_9NOCA|nr:transcriptional regulator [Nocardia albiluteola]
MHPTTGNKMVPSLAESTVSHHLSQLRKAGHEATASLPPGRPRDRQTDDNDHLSLQFRTAPWSTPRFAVNWSQRKIRARNGSRPGGTP